MSFENVEHIEQKSRFEAKKIIRENPGILHSILTLIEGLRDLDIGSCINSENGKIGITYLGNSPWDKRYYCVELNTSGILLRFFVKENSGADPGHGVREFKKTKELRGKLDTYNDKIRLVNEWIGLRVKGNKDKASYFVSEFDEVIQRQGHLEDMFTNRPDLKERWEKLFTFLKANNVVDVHARQASYDPETDEIILFDIL